MEQKFGTWFRLDNAAKIYPAAQTMDWSPMYRFSVVLDAPVDLNTLEYALDKALKRFPVFSCTLRRGFFWHYLEHIEGRPPITEDVNNPMTRLFLEDNGGFLFRMRIYRNRLAIELFHSIADGRGALPFFMSLLREYLKVKYGEDIPTEGYVLDCDDVPPKEEVEDSFLKYAVKGRLSKREAEAYRPQGRCLSKWEAIITTGVVPTNQLLETAHSFDATIGEFFTSLLILSLLRQQDKEAKGKARRLPVKVSVPIDLRRFFYSRTLRNFSSYVNIGVDSQSEPFTFHKILAQVKGMMKTCVTREKLRARFSGNVATERNPMVRILPLIIKQPLMRLGYHILGNDKCTSATLSNLGLVKLPQQMSRHINRLDVLLGLPRGGRSECAVVSCCGKTSINFTRIMESPAIEREFFCELVKMGVPVYVETNRRNK